MKTRPRRWLVFVPALLLSLALAAPALGHRCGKYNVLPGERKVSVLQKCGEPEFREIVGYVWLREGVELPVEEFWYPTPHGVHHVLTFVGPELRSETSVRKP